eukprot:763892-Hanusia_phi.AAC.1
MKFPGSLVYWDDNGSGNGPNRLHHLQSMKQSAFNQLAGKRISYASNHFLVVKCYKDALSSGEVVSFFMKSQANGTTSNFTGAANVSNGTESKVEEQVFVPKEVAFECGGQDNAKACVAVVESCTQKADAYLASVYKNNPFKAAEQREELDCQCFVSNGCSPSCNVALYMVWATGTGAQCLPRPPVYLESIGAFQVLFQRDRRHGMTVCSQYGDPTVTNVMPSDISYDYFPEYPNPAGWIAHHCAYLKRSDMRRYPSRYKYLPLYYYDDDAYSPRHVARILLVVWLSPSCRPSPRLRSGMSCCLAIGSYQLTVATQMNFPIPQTYFYDPYSGRARKSRFISIETLAEDPFPS